MLRLTYRELGDRLGISADGARFLARRRAWKVDKGNDGRARVILDDGQLADELGRSHPIARPINLPIDPDHDRVGLLSEVERLRGGLMLSAERAAKAEGQVIELHNALSDLAGRLDRATAELTEARRSWLDRVLAALRR